MRYRNARLPLLIAVISAGLTYHLVGWSSPFGGVGLAIHRFVHAHSGGESADYSVSVKSDTTPAAAFDGVVLETKAAATIVIGEASNVVVD